MSPAKARNIWQARKFQSFVDGTTLLLKTFEPPVLCVTAMASECICVSAQQFDSISAAWSLMLR